MSRARLMPWLLKGSGRGSGALDAGHAVAAVRVFQIGLGAPWAGG